LVQRLGWTVARKVWTRPGSIRLFEKDERYTIDIFFWTQSKWHYFSLLPTILLKTHCFIKDFNPKLIRVFNLFQFNFGLLSLETSLLNPQSVFILGNHLNNTTLEFLIGPLAFGVFYTLVFGFVIFQFCPWTFNSCNFDLNWLLNFDFLQLYPWWNWLSQTKVQLGSRTSNFG
jgi:hypothetical protein